MSDKLEERVEQIIDKKLGLHQPKTRRTANEIRDQIQKELEKRPKTEHEISNAVNATRSTVQNHCEHLAEINVAKQIEVKELRYWKSNSD